MLLQKRNLLQMLCEINFHLVTLCCILYLHALSHVETHVHLILYISCWFKSFMIWDKIQKTKNLITCGAFKDNWNVAFSGYNAHTSCLKMNGLLWSSKYEQCFMKCFLLFFSLSSTVVKLSINRLFGWINWKEIWAEYWRGRRKDWNWMMEYFSRNVIKVLRCNSLRLPIYASPLCPFYDYSFSCLSDKVTLIAAWDGQWERKGSSWGEKCSLFWFAW